MNRTRWIFLFGIGILGLVLAIASVAIKTVQEGDTVTVNYSLTLDDGSVYYTTSGSNPIKETLGEGKFIPGFEEAVLGMRVGGSKTVTIPPEKAYGQYRSDLVGPVSRDRLPEDLEPFIGEKLRINLEDGTQVITVVTDITEETVTLDANHPLAGQMLTFDIQLVAVEKNKASSGFTDQAVLTWAFLASGGLALGFAVVYTIRQAGFRGSGVGAVQNVRLREGPASNALSPEPSNPDNVLASKDELGKRRISFRKSWTTWLWISLVAVGTLFIGYALVSTFAGGKAQVGDSVSVHYMLRLDDGMVYNATREGEPKQLTLGDGMLIPGVEEALLGMRAGESKTVRIPPEKAYGPYRPELVTTVSRRDLPEGAQPIVGQRLTTTQEDGTPINLLITEVTEANVTVDANHPLAGENLTFEVKLVGIGDLQASGILTRRIVSIGVPVILIMLLIGFGFFYIRRHRKPQPFMR